MGEKEMRCVRALRICHSNEDCQDCEFIESDRDEMSCVNILFENAAEIIESLSEQLESAQPKWISVDERLPEPNRKVLTIRMDLSGKGRHAYALDNIIPWTDAIPFIWLGDLETWKNRVTHWMPLPEPPKEEA